MIKSKENSFFIILHVNSQKSYEIFNDDPKYKNENIIILQTEILVTDYIIIECIYNKYY